MMQLWQITTPRYCAGFEYDVSGNVVIRSAPILYWLRGWPMSRVRERCRRMAETTYQLVLADGVYIAAVEAVNSADGRTKRGLRCDFRTPTPP